mmetsp:Transcript_32313/g.108863  ORF Transcript_32313/g.108863 Transcript_32313/m.108863 type:complete len:86 (-) Transcript_32313:83-340(-)
MRWAEKTPRTRFVGERRRSSCCICPGISSLLAVGRIALGLLALGLLADVGSGFARLDQRDDGNCERGCAEEHAHDSNTQSSNREP